MYITKILFGMLIVLCVLVPASADWFDDTEIADGVADLESGAMSALHSAVGLDVIACFVVILVGKITKSTTLVKMGLGGYALLIVVVVVYTWSIGFFDYWMGEHT